MLNAIVVLGGIAVLFGGVLAVASKKLHVVTDPRLDLIIELLPGANCGACGFPGCGGLANAIVKGDATASSCLPCSLDSAQGIAKIMGQEVSAVKINRKAARLSCNGSNKNTKSLYAYEGVEDCHAVANQFAGPKECPYSCIGFGSCIKACKFGAIKKTGDDLITIDPLLCTGCGACINQCPQNVLHFVPVNQRTYISCSNRDRGPAAKNVCEVSCIACTLCVKACPKQAITMQSFKSGALPVIDSEKCDNCGECVKKCPRKSILMIDPIEDKPLPTIKEDAPTGCNACGACKK